MVRAGGFECVCRYVHICGGLLDDRRWFCMTGDGDCNANYSWLKGTKYIRLEIWPGFSQLKLKAFPSTPLPIHYVPLERQKHEHKTPPPLPSPSSSSWSFIPPQPQEHRTTTILLQSA